MSKTRVLVVDDSVVTRRMISSMVDADPELELAGIAGNGKIALAKIAQLHPDVITLDIEMPEMDGFETLREIRKNHGRLPVVMFSVLTERSAPATLQALSLGATDYVTKPTTNDGLARARDELTMKLRSLGRNQRARATLAEAARRVSVAPTSGSPAVNITSNPPKRDSGPRSLVPARPSTSPARTSFTPPAVMAIPPLGIPRALAAELTARVEIVAIGSSTGGPNALAELFEKLPKNFPVPIVVTQHMPPLFTRLLAERLSSASALEVHEAKSGDVLMPGHAYLAPGDFHMALVRDGTQVKIALNQDPPENSCRPAVDPMLRSVLAIYGAGTLAVICTGMGQDGFRGCQDVRALGGQVLAQDEATSVVWGMPGFVAKGGLAHAILPIQEIAGEIVRRASQKRIARSA